MHIAAMNPVGVSPEDIPEDVVERERSIFREQALEMGKPEKMLEKIVEGKVNKFYKEASLMNQPYVKDPKLTVTDILNELIAKIGESIKIKRFVRFQLGE
jgi:elongation factor Ts